MKEISSSDKLPGTFQTTFNPAFRERREVMMNRSKLTLIAGLCGFVFFLSSYNVSAKTYQYVDEKGILTFTHDLAHVPPQFQSQAEEWVPPSETSSSATGKQTEQRGKVRIEVIVQEDETQEPRGEKIAGSH